MDVRKDVARRLAAGEDDDEAPQQDQAEAEARQEKVLTEYGVLEFGHGIKSENVGIRGDKNGLPLRFQFGVRAFVRSFGLEVKKGCRRRRELTIPVAQDVGVPGAFGRFIEEETVDEFVDFVAFKPVGHDGKAREDPFDLDKIEGGVFTLFGGDRFDHLFLKRHIVDTVERGRRRGKKQARDHGQQHQQHGIELHRTQQFLYGSFHEPSPQNNVDSYPILVGLSLSRTYIAKNNLEYSPGTQRSASHYGVKSR